MCAQKDQISVAAEGISCETVRDASWSGKEYEELLSLAEQKYQFLVTIDKNIKHQQNLAGRKISILIIRTVSNDYEGIRHLIPAAVEALKSIHPGHFLEIASAP